MKATRFQKRSAAHIFRRMFSANGSECNRFLLADEPGLGKTIVTRELISYYLKKSSKKKTRIVYICSNAGIITQNTSRLLPEGAHENAQHLSSVRLTTWPLHLAQHRAAPLLVIPFTPNTALYLGRSQGLYTERIYLLRIINRVYPAIRNTASFLKLFRGQVHPRNWIKYIRMYRKEHDEAFANLPAKTINAYRRNLEEYGLTEDYIREVRRNPESAAILNLLNKGRQAMALTAIDDLSPDLIILDEFQRFRNVMQDAMKAEEQDADGKSGNRIIEKLFRQGSKILMVSATPFKMLTTYSDSEDDDHHQNVVDVFSFLCENNQGTIATLKSGLAEYRKNLFNLTEDNFSLAREKKQQLENLLKRYMIRTERAAFFGDGDTGLKEVKQVISGVQDAKVQVSTQALLQLRSLLQLAGRRDFPKGTVLGYWKSGGYLANVMQENSYELVKTMDKYKEFWSSRINRLLENTRYHDLANHQGNYLRDLFFSQLEAHKTLWLPPTFPLVLDSKYAHKLPSEDDSQFGKLLVFSSWRFVPRYVSAFLSLEANKLLGILPRQDAGDGSAHNKTSLLNFSASRQSTFFVCFPSYALAEVLSVRDFIGRDTNSLVELAHQEIEKRLKRYKISVRNEAARLEYKGFLNRFLLLDEFCGFQSLNAVDRFDDYYSTEADDDEVSDARLLSAYHDDLIRFREELGTNKLYFTVQEIQLMAEIAVKSPAIAIVRALFFANRLQISKENDQKCVSLLLKNMRRFFDRNPAQKIIRNDQEGDEWYWKSVLNFAYQHEFQSVIEEYIFGLANDHSILNPQSNSEEGVEAFFSEMVAVFSIRPGNVELRTGQKQKINIRRHFALPYENLQAEGSELRAEGIRQAFNSPFWPFVIATTSIGQEGIDFHKYCHDIMHWNLPANPVDLEQRDGRINRYNGLVVRRNIAEEILNNQQRLKQFTEALQKGGSLWATAFQLAAELEKNNPLAPHWVFPGRQKINRHMVFLPFSREKQNYEALKKSLANYRVTFGQPRQSDIIDRLNKNSAISADKIRELYINLMP